jgi:hypothetical protein
MQTFYTPAVLAALHIKKSISAEYFAQAPVQRDAHNQVLMKDEETRHLHRVRARAAYLSGRPAPQPRRHRREGPMPSRQYATISTEAARDPRLCAGTVKLITLLAALAGRDGYTDARNGSLAGTLKCHPSTVQRYLAEAERFGYARRELRHNARGSVICRRLWLTDKVWPDWHRNRANPRKDCRRKPAVPITPNAKKEESAPSDRDENKTHRYIQPRIGETTG